MSQTDLQINLCDDFDGFRRLDDERLYLSITHENLSVAKRKEVADAIEKTLRALGYEPLWIPVL